MKNTARKTDRKRVAWRFIVVAALMTFGAAACGGGGEEVEDKNPVRAAAKEAVAEKLDEAAKKADEKLDQAIQGAPDIRVEEVLGKSDEAKSPLETYSYDPINKVDPFAETDASADLPLLGSSDENVLTKYEIRYFRLVGIINDEAQARAIFEDPAGRSYVVTTGTPIGRNLGVIDAILNDAVVVTEKRIIPGTDELETVPLSIRLHPEREEGTPSK